MNRKRIMAAMSGGVDSSVAALLLKEQGHDVVGVTMCLGVANHGGTTRQCCGPEAVKDARTVCDTIGIPHYVMDFSSYLDKWVVRNFVDEYVAGRTPNPCVRCNRYLKFDVLLRKARAMGFDALATGHYAKIVSHNGAHRLMRPRDRKKDQTYFLYGIPGENLAYIEFPLGELTKDEVRRIAARARFRVAEKPGSQDICFVGGDYRSMIDGSLMLPGRIVDHDGAVVGTHEGIVNYTIGQRRGLGIAAGRPRYVTGIDAASNTIRVGPRNELLSTGLSASALNLLTDCLPHSLSCRIRYAHPPSACSVSVDGDRADVSFAVPQEAVTPGQSVVFYDGDTVLGGGVIDASVSGHRAFGEDGVGRQEEHACEAP